MYVALIRADEAHIWDIRQHVGMVFQNPDNQIVKWLSLKRTLPLVLKI